MIAVSEVQARLDQAFPAAQIQVVDLTGTQDHYEATIVTAAFEGKSTLEQHRLVYAALGDAMDGTVIHALALKTYTPNAWQLQQRGS